jgi:hypothetical protein
MAKAPPVSEPHYLFQCVNPDCAKPILLHIESLRQQPGIQRFQATGIPSLAVVCAHCRHVQSYSRIESSPNFDPTAKMVSADHISYAARAGLFECNEEACEVPLPLFVF